MQHLRESRKKNLLEDYLLQNENQIKSEDTLEEAKDFSVDPLLTAINQLPDHHRLVFNLYVIDGYTHAQIATELGITEGTSKSHRARARKKLNFRPWDLEQVITKKLVLVFSPPIMLNVSHT